MNTSENSPKLQSDLLGNCSFLNKVFILLFPGFCFLNKSIKQREVDCIDLVDSLDMTVDISKTPGFAARKTENPPDLRGNPIAYGYNALSIELAPADMINGIVGNTKFKTDLLQSNPNAILSWLD